MARKGLRKIQPAPSQAKTGRLTVRPGRAQGSRWFGRMRVLVVVAVFVGLLSSIVISLALIYYTIRFPDPMALRQRDSAPIVRVLASDGSLLSERGEAHDFIPFDLMPRHIIDAVTAIEDSRYFDHYGLDPVGLMRAMLANLRAGRYAQGGSTITQQLAKNLFLTPERSLRRKIEELMLAVWLEARLTKQDIIELYLNRVYFGSGAYGIEAAAQRYFGKSARTVSLGEAAVIAGLLKAPSRYSPVAAPTLARARGRLVLKRMQATGRITPAEERKAAYRPVAFAPARPSRATSGYEYAAEYVLEHLPPLVGVTPKEVVVETTIDAPLQRRAQAIVERALAAEARLAGAGQGAVLVVDMEGRIRALVGGRSFAESQFDRAATARRQPGSAFKPLVYLAALERGRSPDSLVQDAPISVGDWSPRNDTGSHQGEITLRQALAQSVNTVAVRLQQEVGSGPIMALARRLGIKSDLRDSPALALGTSELSLLELTGAYGVLANGGLGVTPHAVNRVRTGTGSVIYARPRVKPRRLVAAEHARAMSDMLNAAIGSGTGRRALLSGHTAAGKTGTTQEFRDAWFVGYTAHFAAGVWVGNDDARPMNRVTGGGLPARIWREVMMAAHEGLAPRMLSGARMRPGAQVSGVVPSPPH